MVVAPCRAFTQAARWNGSAPQTATGAASVSASHCQLVNWSAGIIDSSATGIPSAAEMRSRVRRTITSSDFDGEVFITGTSGGNGAVAV